MPGNFPSLSLIRRGEPHPVRAELPLQDQELVTQREDLRVFLLAAHRQQAQQREHVRHAKVGHYPQHGLSPCHAFRVT
jgi:outer membrane protein TolC